MSDQQSHLHPSMESAYNPDWGSQQAKVDAGKFRIRGLDDNRGIVLYAYTDTNDTKVHEQKRP